MPVSDADDLAARYQFSDLQSFLDLYYANMATLLTAQDFAEMTDAYLARPAPRSAPTPRCSRTPGAYRPGRRAGGGPEGVTSVLNTSLARVHLSTGLIITMLRDLSAESAMATLEQSSGSVPRARIGLDSAKSATHREVSRTSSTGPAEGLHTVATPVRKPSAYIWEALDLLGGSASTRHPVPRGRASRGSLVEEQIPLTVCPLSNVRSRWCPTCGRIHCRCCWTRGCS